VALDPGNLETLGGIGRAGAMASRGQSIKWCYTPFAVSCKNISSVQSDSGEKIFTERRESPFKGNAPTVLFRTRAAS